MDFAVWIGLFFYIVIGYPVSNFVSFMIAESFNENWHSGQHPHWFRLVVWPFWLFILIVFCVILIWAIATFAFEDNQ